MIPYIILLSISYLTGALSQKMACDIIYGLHKLIRDVFRTWNVFWTSLGRPLEICAVCVVTAYLYLGAFSELRIQENLLQKYSCYKQQPKKPLPIFRKCKYIRVIAYFIIV